MRIIIKQRKLNPRQHLRNSSKAKNQNHRLFLCQRNNRLDIITLAICLNRNIFTNYASGLLANRNGAPPTSFSPSPPRPIPRMSSNNGTTPSFSGMKFSLSSKSTKSTTTTTSKPASTLGKRPRTALHHADSDNSEDERAPAAVAVTGFGAAGAESHDTAHERRARAELVIEKLGNRDWRGEIRRRKAGEGRNLLPAEVQAQRAGAAAARETRGDVAVGAEEEIKWGLSVRRKEEASTTTTTGDRVEVQTNDKVVEVSNVGTQEAVAPVAEEKPRTDDERALDALLGRDTKPKGPDLVIASGPDTTYSAPDSDGDAYARALAAAPDVSTLEDYERVPVEDFGAALLRGMGWKGEKVAMPKEGKRRLNLLGLGAKELKGAEELGAWVQKSDVKRLNAAGSGGHRKERKERPSEYREREDRKRRERDDRYGGRDERDSRDSRDYRDRDRDRRR